MHRYLPRGFEDFGSCFQRALKMPRILKIKDVLFGALIVLVIDAIAIFIDPFISAHVWCAVVQSPRCF